MLLLEGEKAAQERWLAAQAGRPVSFDEVSLRCEEINQADADLRWLMMDCRVV